eukprot:1790766-Amphidinium_carterae.1
MTRLALAMNLNPFDKVQRLGKHAKQKQCYHRNSIPESKHIAFVGWVRWSVHRGSLPPFARHPCRPFRLAGACADSAVVQ